METTENTELNNRLLTTENQLLRQAIMGLAGESGFLFCFSCFNYGKTGDYNTTKCVRCGEWTCDDCTGIHNQSLLENQNDPTVEVNEIEYCDPCYDQIKDKTKTVLLTISEETDNGDIVSMNLNRFKDLFETNEVVDYITDMINDLYECGENYMYEIHLLNLYQTNEDECGIGFYFEIKDEYAEDNPNTSLEVLKDDLVSYLYEGMEGINFDVDSEYQLNPEYSDNKILHLEIC